MKQLERKINLILKLIAESKTPVGSKDISARLK